MNISACLTNKSDIWETPKDLYNFYKNLDYFDPCPINPSFNGLEIDWKQNNFVNPPYSQIKLWVDKAIYERNKGNRSVFLIPSRTDTKYFEKMVNNNVNIYFIIGRLKFNDGKGSAPFPSMLVVFDPHIQQTTFKIIQKTARFWE